VVVVVHGSTNITLTVIESQASTVYAADGTIKKMSRYIRVKSSLFYPPFRTLFPKLWVRWHPCTISLMVSSWTNRWVWLITGASTLLIERYVTFIFYFVLLPNIFGVLFLYGLLMLYFCRRHRPRTLCVFSVSPHVAPNTIYFQYQNLPET